MFNLQGSEIIIILLLALVVLGPEKLPEAMRKAGKFYADIRKMSSGFQEEFRAAMDEPIREVRETANMLRDSADFTKLQADEREETPKSAEMGDAPTDAVPPTDAVVPPPSSNTMPDVVELDDDDDDDEDDEIGFATSGREPLAPPAETSPVDINKPRAEAPPPPPPPAKHAPFPGSTNLALGMSAADVEPPEQPEQPEPAPDRPTDPFAGASTLGLGLTEQPEPPVPAPDRPADPAPVDATPPEAAAPADAPVDDDPAASQDDPPAQRGGSEGATA